MSSQLMRNRTPLCATTTSNMLAASRLKKNHETPRFFASGIGPQILAPVNGRQHGDQRDCQREDGRKGVDLHVGGRHRHTATPAATFARPETSTSSDGNKADCAAQQRAGRADQQAAFGLLPMAAETRPPVNNIASAIEEPDHDHRLSKGAAPAGECSGRPPGWRQGSARASPVWRSPRRRPVAATQSPIAPADGGGRGSSG